MEVVVTYPDRQTTARTDSGTEEARSRGSILIVGCGRWSMGDDQAGLLAASRIRERDLPNTVVITSEDPVADLAAEDLRDLDVLIVVDAARADEQHPAGSFLRMDYQDRPRFLIPRTGIDTHSISVAAALELAASLMRLPSNVWIYMVFGGGFDRRMVLEAVPAAAISSLADRIENDVNEWRRSALCTNSP